MNCVEKCMPFKVQMTCGHIETRMMREATAGIAWTPDALLIAKAACQECRAIEEARLLEQWKQR